MRRSFIALRTLHRRVPPLYAVMSALAECWGQCRSDIVSNISPARPNDTDAPVPFARYWASVAIRFVENPPRVNLLSYLHSVVSSDERLVRRIAETASLLMHYKT